MTAPSVLTPHQLDILKTAAAVVYVLDENALHPSLRQTTPLSKEQIAALANRFSDGLDRWDREVKAHRAPGSIEANQIAIASVILSQRYANAIPRDDRGEITLPVSDIVLVWNDLAGDMSRYSDSHPEWENRIHALFGPNPAVATTPMRAGRQQAGQAAKAFGLAVAKSMGVDGIFNPVLNAGQVPEASVPALPVYAATDPRSEDPQLMAKLQLELSVTEGLLTAITPQAKNETHANRLSTYVKEHAATALGTVTDLFVPAGLSRLSSQLSDTQKVLEQSRDLLKVCLYGTEQEVAAEAAQHAVERNAGAIFLLAIIPNVPFVIPTLEVRLAVTKPLYYVTRGAHATLGQIPIFGFFFLLLRWMGEFIDAIPRLQVRLIQGLYIDNWMVHPKKRAQLIRRYLNYADRRATKPRVEAFQRVLLGIVS
jgi:hypothetical protein